MAGFEIAVIGASGMVGEALCARLAESRLPVDSVRAWASRGSRTEAVDVGEKRVPVEPITELGAARPAVAFLCLPPAVGGKLGPALIQRGIFVIDVGNSLAGLADAPLFLPGVATPAAVEAAHAGAVRTPSAPGWLLARLLAPVAELVTGASAVVAVPASTFGRAATEELSEQVVASFNLKDPPRRIFAEGLAFDTLPMEHEAGEWSEREALATAEVAVLAHVPGVGAQIVVQPLFTGLSAAVHLRGTITVEAAEARWREAKDLLAATPSQLRPRKLTGKRSVAWGALRPDPAGGGVFVQAVADNLAGTAAIAVRAAEWAMGEGLFGAGQA